MSENTATASEKNLEGPIRILVQTITNLVPGKGYDERLFFIIDEVCKHHWGRKHDFRSERWSEHGARFGYDNRRCYFLVDHGESSNDDDVPVLWYEWTGESLKLITRPLPEEMRERLKGYPFTRPDPKTLPRRPPQDEATRRKNIKHKLRREQSLFLNDLEFLMDPEEANWLKENVEPRFWRKYETLVNGEPVRIICGPSPLWMKSLAVFSGFLRAGSLGQERTADPVKIAIIDDGFDARRQNLETIITRNVTDVTFGPGQASSDSTTLGKPATLMGSVIGRVFPDASLSIASLESPAPNAICVTARSVAKAIDWAVEGGADIISMSVTIEAGPNAADLEHLRTAIEKAYAAKVLLLCSIGDRLGNSVEQLCPDQRGMYLLIGAATFYGIDLDQGSNGDVDFWFPGKAVPFKTGDGTAFTFLSGRSLATAAASGLAGILIYCSRLLGDNGGSENPFRDRSVVSNAFAKMPGGSDRRFPRAYDIFTKGFKAKLLSEDPEGHKEPDIATLEWNDSSKKALSSLIAELR